MEAAKNVVPVLLDFSRRGDSPAPALELKDKYAVRGFPTMLIVSPEGMVVATNVSREAGRLAQLLASQPPGKNVAGPSAPAGPTTSSSTKLMVLAGIIFTLLALVTGAGVVAWKRGLFDAED